MNAPMTALVFVLGMLTGAAVLCGLLFAALHDDGCRCSDCESSGSRASLDVEGGE